jgi:short-subunit dehydrogenase involved in D-alanine esterification of teichoic acids
MERFFQTTNKLASFSDFMANNNNDFAAAQNRREFLAKYIQQNYTDLDSLLKDIGIVAQEIQLKGSEKIEGGNPPLGNVTQPRK